MTYLSFLKAVMLHFLNRATSRGVHPPEAMMHFPSCFRFSPCFRKVFLNPWKIFKIYLFPKNFEFSLYFSYSTTFPPLSRKSDLPLLFKTSPQFSLPSFYILYVFFISSPSLTMMQLCLTQSTYWPPLAKKSRFVGHVSHIGRVDAFRQKGHGFDSRSGHHVGTLGKSLTHNFL